MNKSWKAERMTGWTCRSVARRFRQVVVSSVFLLFCCVGCDRALPPAPPQPSPVTVTNVVERIREVALTNVVTVVVTNAVVERREPERVLSARKTAPYLVVAKSFDEARLRKLAADSAARVIESGQGAVALVEATDKAAGLLRAVATVMPLSAADKVGADVGERVKIVPTSMIDAAAVAGAVRQLDGEIVQVVTVGCPAVRAKLPYSAVHKLAERGDVRRIERDEK